MHLHVALPYEKQISGEGHTMLRVASTYCRRRYLAKNILKYNLGEPERVPHQWDFIAQMCVYVYDRPYLRP